MYYLHTLFQKGQFYEVFPVGNVKNLKNMHSICYLPLRTIVIATGDKTIEYCNMQHCNNAIQQYLKNNNINYSYNISIT